MNTEQVFYYKSTTTKWRNDCRRNTQKNVSVNQTFTHNTVYTIMLAKSTAKQNLALDNEQCDSRLPLSSA